jgi:hypothetical protein
LKNWHLLRVGITAELSRVLPQVRGAAKLYSILQKRRKKAVETKMKMLQAKTILIWGPCCLKIFSTMF